MKCSCLLYDYRKSFKPYGSENIYYVSVTIPRVFGGGEGLGFMSRNYIDMSDEPHAPAAIIH